MKIETSHTVKVSAMTKTHKSYRAKWSAEIQQADIWHLPWLFTDEASMQDDPNRPFIRRVPGIVLPHYFHDFKSYPMKVMVWGAIAEGYRSPLMRVDGMINQEKYREVLLALGVFEAMDAKYGRGDWVFMADGPLHIEQNSLGNSYPSVAGC
jgi:hypothetical protein